MLKNIKPIKHPTNFGFQRKLYNNPFYSMALSSNEFLSILTQNLITGEQVPKKQIIPYKTKYKSIDNWKQNLIIDHWHRNKYSNVAALAIGKESVEFPEAKNRDLFITCNLIYGKYEPKSTFNPIMHHHEFEFPELVQQHTGIYRIMNKYENVSNSINHNIPNLIEYIAMGGFTSEVTTSKTMQKLITKVTNVEKVPHAIDIWQLLITLRQDQNKLLTYMNANSIFREPKVIMPAIAVTDDDFQIAQQLFDWQHMIEKIIVKETHLLTKNLPVIYQFLQHQLLVRLIQQELPDNQILQDTTALISENVAKITKTIELLTTQELPNDDLLKKVITQLLSLINETNKIYNDVWSRLLQTLNDTQNSNSTQNDSTNDSNSDKVFTDLLTELNDL